MAETLSRSFLRSVQSCRPIVLLPLVVAALLGQGTFALRAQVFYVPPYGDVDDDPRFSRLHRGGVLPERVIARTLRQEGFRPLGRMVLNSDVYVLDALDPDGAHVRLIVGAFDGEIVQAFVNRRAPSIRIDPDDDAKPDVAPRRKAQPSTRAPSPPVARLPEVRPPQPRSGLPAVTPDRPTIVKRSPLAIPKDPQPAAPAGKPVQGSKALPRVIPIGPDVKAPATTVMPPPEPSPVAPAQPAPGVEARRAPLTSVDMPALPPAVPAPDLGAAQKVLPTAPPPAVLDFRSGTSATE